MKAKDVAMAVDAIRYRGLTLTFSAYLGKTKVKTNKTETNRLLSVARLSGHPLVSCKNVAYSQN